MSKLFTVLFAIITLSFFEVSNVNAMGKQDTKPLERARDDFGDGKTAVYSGRYEEAIRLLTKVVNIEPKNADAHNYLGYSYRKIGKLELAASAYQHVFAINPDHKGALEYQGELFLKQSNLFAAKENLSRLKKLCPSGCKELAELGRAIADFNAVRGN